MRLLLNSTGQRSRTASIALTDSGLSRIVWEAILITPSKITSSPLLRTSPRANRRGEKSRNDLWMTRQVFGRVAKQEQALQNMGGTARIGHADPMLEERVRKRIAF